MLSRRIYEMTQLCGEDGAAIGLEYYLLCETIGNCQSYGAEIVLERGQERESAAARNLTTSPQRIERFLALLYRNSVTPCALPEILHDVLRENTSQNENFP